MIERRNFFVKQPSEVYPIDIHFGNAVPLGAETIAHGTVEAVKWPRKKPKDISDATTEILPNVDPVVVLPTRLKLRILVFGGEHNYEYKITVKAFFDNGAVLEEELYMRVHED